MTSFLSSGRKNKNIMLRLFKREVRTLIINAVANPPSYPRSQGGDLSGRAPTTGLFTDEDQHAPVELLITPARILGSSPSRCPRSIASPTTICSTPRTKLLQILAARPEPEGPQWKIFFPMRVRNGYARLKPVSVPPTRNERVRAFAPVTPARILQYEVARMYSRLTTRNRSIHHFGAARNNFGCDCSTNLHI